MVKIHMEIDDCTMDKIISDYLLDSLDTIQKEMSGLAQLDYLQPHQEIDLFDCIQFQNALIKTYRYYNADHTPIQRYLV